MHRSRSKSRIERLRLKDLNKDNYKEDNKDNFKEKTVLSIKSNMKMLRTETAKYDIPLDDIDIKAIVDKFSLSDKSNSSSEEYFIRRDSLLKNDGYIDRILDEMYNVPKEIRMDLFKVKIMELLLRLKMLDKSLYKDERLYIPAGQAEKIKEVHKLIIASPEKNYTVEDLSKLFGIPESTLRKNFREIYGSPIYKYIKKVKINKAAELLKSDSNLKILDVAEIVGYDNPSKFAAAFKDVMGLTPMEFKQKNEIEVVR